MKESVDFISTSSGNEYKCTLCEKKIANYSPEFNHLEIDNAHSVDICRACRDKIFKWQQGIYARLFPTKVMKKIVRKDRD